MWCENVPDLTGRVPNRPSRHEAEAALSLIRGTFKTFCFADAQTIYDATAGVPVVDLSKPPGFDESSFLAALMTAVCRSSLHLAPGVLLRAASMSGAGAGKGLLARCICIVAFGREPHAVTAGATAEELQTSDPLPVYWTNEPPPHSAKVRLSGGKSNPLSYLLLCSN
jgi:hypothetical protein